MRFLQHCRTLVFLFAHVQEAHLRVLVTEVGLGEGGTGDGEIHQGRGAFIYVGTGVHQDDGTVGSRNHATDRRTAELFAGLAQKHEAAGHHGTGVTGAHGGVHHALFLEGDAGHQTGMGFLLENLDGMFVHGHRIGGIDDRNSLTRIAELCQFLLDHGLGAAEDNVDIGVLVHRIDGAFNNHIGGKIATQSIQSYTNHGNLPFSFNLEQLGFGTLHVDNFYTIVETADRAHAVRALHRTAVVASSHGGRFHLPMGAALVTTGGRGLSFRYGHF